MNSSLFFPSPVLHYITASRDWARDPGTFTTRINHLANKCSLPPFFAGMLRYYLEAKHTQVITSGQRWLRLSGAEGRLIGPVSTWVDVPGAGHNRVWQRPSATVRLRRGNERKPLLSPSRWPWRRNPPVEAAGLGVWWGACRSRAHHGSSGIRFACVTGGMFFKCWNQGRTSLAVLHRLEQPQSRSLPSLVKLGVAEGSVIRTRETICVCANRRVCLTDYPRPLFWPKSWLANKLIKRPHDNSICDYRW